MTAPPSRLFDPGLQPERTILAWRRFSLAAIAVSLGGLRVMWDFIGAWAIVPATVFLGGALGVLLGSWRRYDRQTRALLAAPARRAAFGDGRLILATALVTLLFGGGALVTLGALALR